MFAEAAAISESMVRKYLAGAEPTRQSLIAMARAGNVSLEWLATGEGPRRPVPVLDPAEVPQPATPKLREPSPLPSPQMLKLDGEFVLVPRYDIEASAGAGVLADAELIVDHLAFSAEWVRRTLRADPKKLLLVTARGDSMEPTIRDGDMLLINTGIESVVDDAIYLIVRADRVAIKRVQRRMSGRYLVKSDNPNYEPDELDPADMELTRIVGRLVWIARVT